jgi:uncharacterized protein YndB with AHSA1/START domain
MSIEFEVSAVIPASPEAVYLAWLSSEEHSGMTGAAAAVSDVLGEEFEAWDGYIRGTNLELEPHRKIVQSWRTSEFADSDPDSRLEIHLEREGDGTKVLIRHSRLPSHGMQYQQGWVDSYFTPMTAYFQQRS